MQPETVRLRARIMVRITLGPRFEATQRSGRTWRRDRLPGSGPAPAGVDGQIPGLLGHPRQVRRAKREPFTKPRCSGSITPGGRCSCDGSCS
jgi:hypothetical protein